MIWDGLVGGDAVRVVVLSVVLVGDVVVVLSLVSM